MSDNPQDWGSTTSADEYFTTRALSRLLDLNTANYIANMRSSGMVIQNTLQKHYFV